MAQKPSKFSINWPSMYVTPFIGQDYFPLYNLVVINGFLSSDFYGPLVPRQNVNLPIEILIKIKNDAPLERTYNM